MPKRVKISPSKNRALLSDVLPYEIPLFFSNKGFYMLLNKFDYEISKTGLLLKKIKKLENKKNQKHVTEGIIKLINGAPDSKTRSFVYEITHKEMEPRSLTIIHPLDQIKMTNFYNKYNSLIIYYCNRSSFSLRFPHKVALFKKQINYFLKEKLTDNTFDSSKINDSNLKNYFVYKIIKNINNFFKNYKYQRAEKKFNYLLKLDVKKCFESILPRSICNAVLDVDLCECKNSMPYQFVELMESFKQEFQKGIVIGPEFSRIFAEMIFQDIDNKIEISLAKSGLLHKIDYEYYRYVDDGFFFFNNTKAKKTFVKKITQELKMYGLFLNDGKKKIIERPFIENKAVAKDEIQKLIDKVFENRMKTIEGVLSMNNGNEIIIPYELKANSIIEEFKIILFKNKVVYKDISAFTFCCLEKDLNQSMKIMKDILVDFNKATIDRSIDEFGKEIEVKYEESYVAFLTEFIDFIFFIFVNDIRTTNSISLTKIIGNIQMFIIDGKTKYQNEKVILFHRKMRDSILKKIRDEILFLFLNNKITKSNQIDLMYLLVIYKNVPKSFKINNKVLNKIFLKKDNSGQLVLIDNMNYFSVFSLIHYIEADVQYQEIRISACKWIEEKAKFYSWEKGINDTETLFAILDSLSCPYITDDWKLSLLDKHKIPKCLKDDLCLFIQNKFDLFVKWNSFSTFDELLAKKSTEVY